MAIFITGHDRSGTTMLQRVCNSHPQMLVTNEFNLFLPLGCSYRTYFAHILRNAMKIENRFRFNQQYKFMGIVRYSNFPFTLSFLISLLKNHQQLIEVSDIERALKKRNPHAIIVGDKKTFYNERLEKLLKYDDLKGVVIYRDCRDVTSSFLQMAKTVWIKQPWVENLKTAGAIARRWVEWIGIMENFADELIIIRYEDLVKEPQKVLGSLAQQLSISSDGFQMQNINSKSIGKYQKGLSNHELNQVLQIAGPTMAKLEYI